jgi:conjugal transfer pilus assembly protein TraD
MRNASRDRTAKTQALILLVGSIVLLRFISIQLIVGAALGVTALRFGRGAYRRYLQEQAGTQPVLAPAGILIGHDTTTKEEARLTEEQLAAHGLIVGASGSGKTTSLLTILVGAIQRGHSVIAIDLKGSPTFANTLKRTAEAVGREYHHWTPDGPGHWNPLAIGNPTELKDKLISTESWSEPHYQRAAERYLQTALQVLELRDPDQPPSLERVVAMLEPKRLGASVGHLPAERSKRVSEYLSGLTSDQRSAIIGLATRLAVISESHTGSYLEPNGPTTIDLATAMREKHVVVFSLNASAYGKLSAQLAALILQDLTLIAGHRLNDPDRELVFIAIDEFSALDHSNILGLFSRARDALLSILLSTQELADLHITPGLQDQILGSSSLTLAHRQNVPSSAETIAKLTGTQTTWEHTWQTDATTGLLSILTGKPGHPSETGLGTKREVEQFRIHPNVIKELPTGHAVLITRIPCTSARIIKVKRPSIDDQHQSD